MSLYQQAIDRLRAALDRAQETDLHEPTAMTLATAAPDGRVSSRTVLLKGLSADGLVFYTNTRSRKGQQLEANPWASLCFFWQPLMEQILVEGRTRRVSDGEADAYFASRPRESQIGAWASAQSDLLDSRETLEARVDEIAREYAGRDVPRPPHWTGYRLTPELIEFWHSKPGRLHVRERYWVEAGEWYWSLVNP